MDTLPFTSCQSNQKIVRASGNTASMYPVDENLKALLDGLLKQRLALQLRLHERSAALVQVEQLTDENAVNGFPISGSSEWPR